METGVRWIRQVAIVLIPAKQSSVSLGQPQALLSMDEAQTGINQVLSQISLVSDVRTIRTKIDVLPFGILAVIEYTVRGKIEGIPDDQVSDEDDFDLIKEQFAPDVGLEGFVLGMGDEGEKS